MADIETKWDIFVDWMIRECSNIPEEKVRAFCTDKQGQWLQHELIREAQFGVSTATRKLIKMKAAIEKIADTL